MVYSLWESISLASQSKVLTHPPRGHKVCISKECPSWRAVTNGKASQHNNFVIFIFSCNIVRPSPWGMQERVIKDEAVLENGMLVEWAFQKPFWNALYSMKKNSNNVSCKYNRKFSAGYFTPSLMWMGELWGTTSSWANFLCQWTRICSKMLLILKDPI
jgi:hypothetical protein